MYVGRFGSRSLPLGLIGGSGGGAPQLNSSKAFRTENCFSFLLINVESSLDDVMCNSIPKLKLATCIFSEHFRTISDRFQTILVWFKTLGVS